MTKDAILRSIEEIDGKLAELRRAVERLPEAVEASQAGPLPEPVREKTVLVRSQVVQFVDKTKLRPMVTKGFVEMNVCGEPIGAESVQAMIAAYRVRAEDNTFSRGLFEMREE